jgi:iron complex outermembrane recepter protein
MSYAKVSTGFRSDGFNPASGTTPFIEFQPENDRSYELGARMDFFDQRLRVNPTIFYIALLRYSQRLPAAGGGNAIADSSEFAPTRVSTRAVRVAECSGTEPQGICDGDLTL